MTVCVSLCVWVRERLRECESESEREGAAREGEAERGKELQNVWMSASVSESVYM
jgi:hypothetical protein